MQRKTGSSLSGLFSSTDKEKKKDISAGTPARMPPRSWEHMSWNIDPHIPRGETNSRTGALSRTSALSRWKADKDQNSSSTCKTLNAVKSQSPTASPTAKQAPNDNNNSDVVIYVGKNRTQFLQSSESLINSSYFRKRLLENPASSQITVDCEESVFENVMTILRYGELEALPQLSDNEKFKLRKELEFLGIEITEDLKQSLVSMNSSNSIIHPHFAMVELPDFPAELGDPSKIVIVARLDETGKGKCECTPYDRPSQWALSFHFRHAFCIGCGERPAAHMSSKTLVEMFQAAALHYSNQDKVSPKKWFVSCDSTCSLKFLLARPCCVCPCSISTEKKKPMWAVSSFHCHAFCTACGKCAEGSALVCIMLTVRYGGHYNRSPKGGSAGSKKDHQLNGYHVINLREIPGFVHPRNSNSSEKSVYSQ